MTTTIATNDLKRLKFIKMLDSNIQITVVAFNTF